MIISNVFFVKRYIRNYNGSEVETLYIGRAWWPVDSHPSFDFDCFKEKNKTQKHFRYCFMLHVLNLHVLRVTINLLRSDMSTCYRLHLVVRLVVQTSPQQIEVVKFGL